MPTSPPRAPSSPGKPLSAEDLKAISESVKAARSGPGGCGAGWDGGPRAWQAKAVGHMGAVGAQSIQSTRVQVAMG